MNKKSLTNVCLEMLSKEINLQRIPGFEDIESVKLASGADGGGIRLYNGEKIGKVTVADFSYGNGVPITHRQDRIGMTAELFQIMPDFSYKLPAWGIDSVLFEDGTYWFDTDFFFGFDLVNDFDFVMKYLDPFNEVYKKFFNNKDIRVYSMAEVTTWVRTHISPCYIIAELPVAKVDAVYELASALIKLWVKMYNDAEKQDESFKKSQIKRITSIYGKMETGDRMAEILCDVYGKKTFAQLFKAIMPNFV